MKIVFKRGRLVQAVRYTGQACTRIVAIIRRFVGCVFDLSQPSKTVVCQRCRVVSRVFRGLKLPVSLVGEGRYVIQGVFRGQQVSVRVIRVDPRVNIRIGTLRVDSISKSQHLTETVVCPLLSAKDIGQRR